MNVLDDVEEQHRVEGLRDERKRRGDVLGEERRVDDADLSRHPLPDREMSRVVVHADDRPAVARRSNEVRAVTAADVEHAIARPQVRQVPVVPGMIHEMLGMDRVSALARQADEPHADRLAAPVYDVDAAHHEAAERRHRCRWAARRRQASSVAS